MAITKIQSESLNLADDYTFTGTITGAGASQEIGTWTPTWTLGGGTITSIDTTDYSYIKIGRIVVAQVQAHLNTSSGSGTIDFTLPFTPSGSGSFPAFEFGQAGAIFGGQYYSGQNFGRMYRLSGFIANPYFKATVTYMSVS